MPAAGYPFHALAVAGIDRSNPLRAARALLLAARRDRHAPRGCCGGCGPTPCMGGGGYVAGPVGLAAAALRLPLVLTEADSHLGVANRLLAPLAERVFLAFPIEGRDGGEVRGRGRPRAARPPGRPTAPRRARRFGDPGRASRCLLVFGGSLGARRLNQAALEAFGAAAPCVVLHASGRRDHDELRAAPRRARRAAALPPRALHRSRSPTRSPPPTWWWPAPGGSVLELAAAGLPAILVPYPHATADHQTANARYMERAGRGGGGAGRRARRRRGWPARSARCCGDDGSAWRRWPRPRATPPGPTPPSGSPTSCCAWPRARMVAARERRPVRRQAACTSSGIGGAGMSGLALVAARARRAR